MTKLKAALERYIDAEANRRAEEILARMRAAWVRRKAAKKPVEPTA